MLKRPWLLVGLGLAALAFIIGIRFITPRSDLLLPPRASNGAEYALYVHVPDRCRSGGCPALYLLDGGRWLPTFTQITETLAARQAMAPVVLVGIGYRAIPGVAPQRQRDFAAGADAYIAALQSDIIPFARSHLPISAACGIVGNGDAASFAAYALTHAPDTFDSYLIINPSAAPPAPFTLSTRPHTISLAAARASMPWMHQLGAALLSDPKLTVSQNLYPSKTGDAIVEPAAIAALPTLFPGE
jgi:predicted alpha/beta superfamily hydrolase